MTHQAPDDEMYDITPSAAIFREMDTALCLMRWRSLELEEAVARNDLAAVPAMVDRLDRVVGIALHAYRGLDQRGYRSAPPAPLGEVMAYGFLMSALGAAERHAASASQCRFEGDDTGAGAASQAYWRAIDIALRAHRELEDTGIIEALSRSGSCEAPAEGAA